ncbi:hypothetical protein IL252_14685 (plasmid) [Halomicrobium sp. IBSBa]|uniref:hypothetical protein n=1 Tax=Halomicrobium sp. IBSBa TaxID=2778916 RepID=UPI001ABFE19E|nr:hypothetical protein [Halomicrobium sp. IBSBa]MBO4249063.1 hypothetical protein [Halomicrobium sp. IBSBa]
MKTVVRSRVVLVLALGVLGGSIAVFATVTGVTAAVTPPAEHEFAIDGGQLVETSGERDRTVVADLRAVERVEIAGHGSSLVVTTTPREPIELPLATRERAKEIVTTTGAFADESTPEGAVYTIRPIPESVRSDTAAVAGADPGTAWTQLAPANDSAFTLRERADGVVVERTERRMSDRRALVVVDPVERATRYSVVVDLENETVDAFVRLREGASGSPRGR